VATVLAAALLSATSFAGTGGLQVAVKALHSTAGLSYSHVDSVAALGNLVVEGAYRVTLSNPTSANISNAWFAGRLSVARANSTAALATNAIIVSPVAEDVSSDGRCDISNDQAGILCQVGPLAKAGAPGDSKSFIIFVQVPKPTPEIPAQAGDHLDISWLVNNGQGGSPTVPVSSNEAWQDTLPTTLIDTSPTLARGYLRATNKLFTGISGFPYSSKTGSDLYTSEVSAITLAGKAELTEEENTVDPTVICSPLFKPNTCSKYGLSIVDEAGNTQVFPGAGLTINLRRHGSTINNGAKPTIDNLGVYYKKLASDSWKEVKPCLNGMPTTDPAFSTTHCVSGFTLYTKTYIRLNNLSSAMEGTLEVSLKALENGFKSW
jgi:hypothetical protein